VRHRFLPSYLSGEGTRPLERETLLELVRRAKAGDAAARSRVVLANVRFCAHLANKWIVSGAVHPDDLLAEALFAFNRCLDFFDPDRGVSLLTYAAQTIVSALSRRVISEYSLVVQKHAFVTGTIKGLRRDIAFDAPIKSGGNDEDSDSSLLDFMKTDGEPESLTIASDEARRAAETIARFLRRRGDARDSFILKARFLREPPISLEDVAKAPRSSAARARSRASGSASSKTACWKISPATSAVRALPLKSRGRLPQWRARRIAGSSKSSRGGPHEAPYSRCRQLRCSPRHHGRCLGGSAVHHRWRSSAIKA
jgi:DNA-directed RNA polymerase sigma subunit (sigma70/sigma32)